MLSPRHAPDGSQFFISSKTVTAIPTRHPLVRDALIQSTLDPVVRSIEFVASARVQSEQVELNAIILGRDDGRYLLDVVPARPLRDIECEGLALIALADLGLTPLRLTAEDIQREPRFANSRLVWQYRLHAVGISMRMRVLQILQDDGPTSLGRLLSSIRCDRDPSPAILAMACSGLIDLDLISRQLGPATMVRSLA